MERSFAGASLIALSLALSACSATLRSYPVPVAAPEDGTKKQETDGVQPDAQQGTGNSTPGTDKSAGTPVLPPTGSADDSTKTTRKVALMESEGLIYRLPKYLFRITSTPQPLQDPAPAQDNGRGDDNKGTVTQSNPPAGSDKGNNDKKSDDNKKAEEGKPKPKTQDGEKDGEDEDTSAAQGASAGPAELLKVTFPQAGKCPAVEIKVVGPIVIGDDRAQASLLLKHDDSAFRSDTIGLTLTSEGLLQSADSQSTGELDTVAKILAQIVFAAITGVPAPLTPTPQPGQDIQALDETGCALATKQFRTFDFDPTKHVGFNIGEWTVEKTVNETLPDLPEFEGIYYRSIAPAPIEFSGGFSGYSVQQGITVMAPTGSIGKLEFKGSLISDGNGTTVKFSKGIPVSYDRVTKSDAVAIASIPLDIINAFLQLPMNVLTFRFEEIKKQREISDEELKIIQNLIEMKKAQSGEDGEGEEPASE